MQADNSARVKKLVINIAELHNVCNAVRNRPMQNVQHILMQIQIESRPLFSLCEAGSRKKQHGLFVVCAAFFLLDNEKGQNPSFQGILACFIRLQTWADEILGAKVA